jgi:hypothetical protein
MNQKQLTRWIVLLVIPVLAGLLVFPCEHFDLLLLSFELKEGHFKGTLDVDITTHHA